MNNIFLQRRSFQWNLGRSVTTLLIAFFACIFTSTDVFATWLEKYPVTVTQPDGTALHLFVTGDEYHHRVHDSEGYTLLRDAAGWVVYADVVNDDLAATAIVYGADNLRGSGTAIAPNLNISAEKWRQLRKQFPDMPKPVDGTPDNPERAVPVTLRTGTLNNIVIYISFPDGNFTYTKGQIEPLFTSSTTGASLYSYYRDISDGNFSMLSAFFPYSATTILSYVAPHPRSYYEISNDDYEGMMIEHTLLRDAINFVKAEIEASFTAAELDSDNDGYVDNVCFMVQGDPGPWSSLLWPHQWALFNYDVMLHNKQVWNYNFLLENHLMTVGNGQQSVLVHEAYHTLGAPDLYVYYGTVYNITPTGAWCVMSSNTVPPQSSSAHVTNYDGRFIADIPEITTSGTYTLYDTWDRNGNPIAYKITSPTSTKGEFFVLEYRRKSGGTVYESNMPDQGIIISRINPTVHGNAESDGTPAYPFGMYVYRQNGTYTNDGNLTNACYKSNGLTTFSDVSSPRAFLSNNTDGLDGIVVDQFSAAGGETMTFRVTFPAYTITTAVSPAGAGTVIGGGMYAEDATVTLTALNSFGYTFSEWSNGSTANPLIFTATESATYTAYFEETSEGEILYETCFDDVPNGSKVAQSYPAWWTTWSNLPGSSEDAFISNEQSSTPPQSAKLAWGNDLVFKAGNKTAGTYAVNFKMYVPNGGSAYFNVLHVFTNGDGEWAVETYFNTSSNGTVVQQNGTSKPFSFPFNTWFPVSIYVNLDDDIATMNINGTPVLTWQFSLTASGGGGTKQLAAMDFYPPQSGSVYYIDDFVYAQVGDPLPPPVISVMPDNELKIELPANSTKTGSFYIVNEENNTQKALWSTYIDYAPLPTGAGPEFNLCVCDPYAVPSSGIGSSVAYSREIAMKLQPADYLNKLGGALKQIGYYIQGDGNDPASNLTLRVYGQGSSENVPGAVLAEAVLPMSNFMYDAWNWVNIPTVQLAGGEYWVSVAMYQAAETFPLTVDAGPALPGGDWLKTGTGTWNKLSNTSSLSFNWAIQVKGDGAVQKMWGVMDQTYGTTNAASQSEITVTASSATYDDGNYTANIVVLTNDPVHSHIDLPLIMAVGDVVYVPVSNISNVPATATAFLPLTLTGAVSPGNATNKTIIWTVENPGTTGATITGTNILNTTDAGTATILATIVNGASPTSDYTQPFTITVSLATLSGTVTISGNAAFDQTLTAVTTALTSSPVIPALGTFSYQWQRGTTNIPDATTPTYTLTAEDIGNTIRVIVSAANCNGDVTSSPTESVTKATQTAPPAPTLAEKDTTSITLNTVTGCEYNINDGAYQPLPVFSELTSNTSYNFTQRYTETATHLASPASPIATFTTDADEVPLYTITSTVNNPDFGTVTPCGEATVEEGDDITFVITSNNGYKIEEVLIDGINDPAAVENGFYTFENVTEDHEIYVVFGEDGVGIAPPSPPEGGDVRVYPNPTSGLLTICDMRCAICDIEIFDVYGRNVSRLTSHIAHPISIDISFLPAGVYFIRITTADGVVVRKVVKE